MLLLLIRNRITKIYDSTEGIGLFGDMDDRRSQEQLALQRHGARQIGLPKEQMLEEATRELKMVQVDRERFQQMSTVYQERWRSVQLRHFALNIALYGKLIELAEQRIGTSEEILKALRA